MTRWSLFGIVMGSGGCTIMVSSDKEADTGGSDPSTSQTDADADADADSDTDADADTDTVTGTGPCDGVYPGTYTTLGNPNTTPFEVEVVSAEMRIYVSGVDNNPTFFDGWLDVAPDGSAYGESQGVWADGAIDWDDCTMSGEWGPVVRPDVATGAWEAGP